jgi:hypothetical protein
MKESAAEYRDLRDAIEVELRNGGARVEEDAGGTVFYPGETPGMRFRLSTDAVTLEGRGDDGVWHVSEVVPYPAAWYLFSTTRKRRAYRVLFWSGVWVGLGVAASLGV